MSVVQKFSVLVNSENCAVSGVFSNNSWTARFNSSPFLPFACMLNELSKTMYISFVAFLLSLASKKGCAKAKITHVSNNKRVANNNLFLILELFRVCTASSLRKRTFVKKEVLKRRNWNKWTKIGTINKKRKYRISGCLKCILALIYFATFCFCEDTAKKYKFLVKPYRDIF